MQSFLMAKFEFMNTIIYFLNIRLHYAVDYET